MISLAQPEQKGGSRTRCNATESLSPERIELTE